MLTLAQHEGTSCIAHPTRDISCRLSVARARVDVPIGDNTVCAFVMNAVCVIAQCSSVRARLRCNDLGTCAHAHVPVLTIACVRVRERACPHQDARHGCRHDHARAFNRASARVAAHVRDSVRTTTRVCVCSVRGCTCVCTR